MGLSVHVRGGLYQFDGPHPNTAAVADRSGVYVISTVQPDGTHKVLDAGESATLKARLDTHDRAHQWRRHQLSGLFASVYYCDEANRMLVERAIRDFHSPPCGIR